MKRDQLVAAVFFVVIFALSLSAIAQGVIDKKAFFIAISSNNSSQIEAQLNALKNTSGQEKEAYEGALLMRKAGTLAVPAKKLAVFKQGHKKLEAAIEQNPTNAEYHFLRLMIQENAPKTLGYYKNIAQDVGIIKSGYRGLPTLLQQFIENYSHNSKALKGAF